MITQDVDTRGLMASVSQIAGEKQYEADVVLESQADDTLSVVFGSLAQSVDSLSFTLLADPEKFTSLTTDNASAKIDNREPWMYVVTMKFNGENIYPGTKVISLKLPKVMSIALVDTTFQSAGLTYNLTSKGK